MASCALLGLGFASGTLAQLQAAVPASAVSANLPSTTLAPGAIPDYELVCIQALHNNSKLCVDFQTGSVFSWWNQPDQIIEYSCNGQPNQKWTWEPVSHDVLQTRNRGHWLRSAQSKQCLGINNKDLQTSATGRPEPYDHQPLILKACDTDDKTTRWSYNPLVGTLNLRAWPHFCLDFQLEVNGLVPQWWWQGRLTVYHCHIHNTWNLKVIGDEKRWQQFHLVSEAATTMTIATTTMGETATTSTTSTSEEAVVHVVHVVHVVQDGGNKIDETKVVADEFATTSTTSTSEPRAHNTLEAEDGVVADESKVELNWRVTWHQVNPSVLLATMCVISLVFCVWRSRQRQLQYDSLFESDCNANQELE
jgi:hypothetical protein